MCKHCTHSIGTVAYPMLQCQLRGIIVASDFYCAKFVREGGSDDE